MCILKTSETLQFVFIVGSAEMVNEVAMNLKLPTSTNATQEFIDFIYLSQVSMLSWILYKFGI